MSTIVCNTTDTGKKESLAVAQTPNIFFQLNQFDPAGVTGLKQCYPLHS